MHMAEERAQAAKRLVDRVLQAHGSVLGRHKYLEILQLQSGLCDSELDRKKQQLMLLLHPDKVDDVVAKLCGGRQRVRQAFNLVEAAFNDAQMWLCSGPPTQAQQVQDDAGDEANLRYRLWEVTLESERKAWTLLEDLQKDSQASLHGFVEAEAPEQQQQLCREEARRTCTRAQARTELLDRKLKNQAGIQQMQQQAHQKLQKDLDENQQNKQQEAATTRRQNPLSQQHPESSRKKKGKEDETARQVVEPNQQEVVCKVKQEERRRTPKQKNNKCESKLQDALRMQVEEMQKLQAEAQSKEMTSQPISKDVDGRPQKWLKLSAADLDCNEVPHRQGAAQLPSSASHGNSERAMSSKRETGTSASRLLIGQVADVLQSCAAASGEAWSGVMVGEFLGGPVVPFTFFFWFWVPL